MSIISISGKAGSGKDTVGKIINYLATGGDETYNDIDGFLKYYDDGINEYPWQIKKYADKLKDMVCLLIGCTREQLEDQKFKSTPLGEEWQGYRVSWHCPGNEYEPFIFYTEQEAVNWLNQEGAETDIECAYRDRCLFEVKLTPRDILQSLGTQWGRNMVHPNLWINSLFADYTSDCPIEKHGAYGHLECGCTLRPDLPNNGCEKPFPNWIITDSSFPNDVEHVKKLGGITIRVNRPECKGRINEHESETALDNYERFNYIINNDGTVEDLIDKVKDILIKENIL